MLLPSSMPEPQAVTPSRNSPSPLPDAGRSRSHRERCDGVRSGIVHLRAGGSGIELRLLRAEFGGYSVGPLFKWIKQHLRIKRFLGTSPNAVKIQIWTAITTYVLIAIVKKQLGLKQSLYTILQILSTSLFEKTPVQLVFQRYDDEISNRAVSNQLTLFEI
jgi:hypothetical protein